MIETRRRPLDSVVRTLKNKAVLAGSVAAVLGTTCLLLLVWAGDAHEMIGANLASFGFMACVIVLIGIIGSADGTATSSNEHK